MGLLEKIDSLELSDEAKEELRREYGVEQGESQEELARLKRQGRKASVEKEIETVAGMFSDNTDDDSKPLRPKPVALLKFLRRVYLSDDEQPGLVLLSDADLELSGDEATGSRSKEELSVAGAVRKVFELLPKDDQGKILGFGDQANIDDDHSKPADEQQESEQAKTEGRKRAERAIGRPIERTRTRFKGTVS